MPPCSRCGATDNRHSKKCYETWALGFALGFEEHPDETRRREGFEEADALVSLRAELAAMTESRDHYRAAAHQALSRPEPEPVPETDVMRFAPVTTLPPDYYDRKIVAPERVAEIDREVERLNDMAASPNLDVTIKPNGDAIVRPRRDDDYTPEAIDRAEEAFDTDDSYPDYGPEDDAAAGMGLPSKTAGALPDDSVVGTRIPGVAGSWAQPETLAAERAAHEFVERFLVPAEGTRTSPAGQTVQAYVTAPELNDAFETWAKAQGIPLVKTTGRYLGTAAKNSPHVTRKGQGPRHDGGKPVCYFGVKLATEQAASPAPAPTPLTLAERNRRVTEDVRALMAKAREQAGKIELTAEAPAAVPHGPDELATKLAQLKRFGIGGKSGVDKRAAETAVADLHPTGRDVWKAPTPEGVADDDLDASAYQLLVKCMNGLPEEVGYDVLPDVEATAGFDAASVEAALRNPQRVEIRPESYTKEKRYPVLGFHRGDVVVILGMRLPKSPRVIAAYWTSLLASDTHRVNVSGGGGSKKTVGLPTTVTAAIGRLRAEGCEIDEPGADEKPVKVTYKGQDLGKITTARTTPKLTIQSDYQRTLRKMQAINRREEARAG